MAKKEQSENARPAFAGDVPDLSQYSTIFIGAPVWWGDWPMIMYTTVGTGLAIEGTDAQNNQDSVKQNVHDWLSELGY